MARVLERLEIRRGPFGSTDTSIVDVIPDVLGMITREEVDGRETARVEIPVLSTAWSSLVERRVLRAVMTDGTVDSEWRIVGLKSARTPGQLSGTIEAESIKYDLGTSLVSRTESGGQVNNYFELYGLTPTQHLGVILADAPSHFKAGTISSSKEIDMVYDWDSPQSSISELAVLAEIEWSVDLSTGSTGYLVNMPAAVGSTQSKAFLRYRRNLAGVSRVTDSRSGQATRVYPRGGGAVGDRLTMAGASWLVTATSTVSATLSTADGRPIAFANQLNGRWVEEPGGTRTQVIDSTTAQVITLAAGHGITTGERVTFRNSSAGEWLTYLEDPLLVATYGTVQRVIDRQDIPRVDNLTANPFFTGTYTAGVPTDWSKVGAPTFAESTAGLFRRYGDKSLKITASSSGQGVISDSIAITPSSESPFFSAQIAIWVVSGTVKLQFIDQSSTQGNVFPPVDSEPAKTTVVGEWVENLGISGIDLLERSSTAVKLRVVAHSTGGAEWYMDAGQVTQTAGGGEVFYNGRASNDLWLAGNSYLVDNAAPRVSFNVSLADLERLDPTGMANAKLVVGGTVQVVDDDMGLDFQTRIIELQRDLLHPGATRLKLSNRPEDLSGLGIPGRSGRRLKEQTKSDALRPEIIVSRVGATSTSVTFELRGLSDKQQLALFHRTLTSTGSSTGVAFTRIPSTGWKESGFSSNVEVSRPSTGDPDATFEAYALDRLRSRSATETMIINAQGMFAPTLEVTNESETSTLGTFEVTLHDPESLSDDLYRASKVGAAAWSAYTLETNTPTDGVAYSQTVALEERRLSFLKWRLRYTAGGTQFAIEQTSAGFDKGKTPDFSMNAVIDENWDALPELDGDFDMRSAKVAFAVGASPSVPSDTAVRARAVVTGRKISAATADAAYGDFPVAVAIGETCIFKAFGYSGSTGDGNESSAPVVAIVSRPNPRPSFDVVDASFFDDGSDIDVTLNFTFLGNVNVTDHQLDVSLYEDGILIDQTTGIAVNVGQPYTGYSAIGRGGFSAGKKYHIAMALVNKTGGATIDSRSTYPFAAAT